jgi:protein-L-isoaspartate(D-aspartate) O-methyltransferase
MKKLPYLLILLSWLVSCSPKTTDTTPPLPSTNPSSSPQARDPYAEARQVMLDEIRLMGVQDENILRIMAAVPRHEFVPDEFLSQAYENHPLPIGYGQTISQPYVVAWMTELLELQPGEKVLEIGTGSGYQAAVLAELDDVQVYTIEIVPELAENAASLLQELGYSNINTKQADGYFGWEEFAPYDAIIVTAAPDHLPAPLPTTHTWWASCHPLGPPG